LHDFLVGVRVNTLDDSENENEEALDAGHKLTEAERLRLVYEIITSPANEGGANISADVDKYVESIFPLHNDELNKVCDRYTCGEKVAPLEPFSSYKKLFHDTLEMD